MDHGVQHRLHALVLEGRTTHHRDDFIGQGAVTQTLPDLVFRELTFFEVLVAMAYAAFADAPVEVAAVEVGMGGGWDATNVVDGAVAVLTPISLDHQHFLGSDLVSIATEKAGIIKPGAVAVLGRQPADVAEVLLRRATEVGATVAREGLEFGVLRRDVAVGGQLLTLQGLYGVYEDVFLPLHGSHQARNAACALAAVEALLGGDAPLKPEIVEVAFLKGNWKSAGKTLRVTIRTYSSGH